jgi:hypothetical protein
MVMQNVVEGKFSLTSVFEPFLSGLVATDEEFQFCEGELIEVLLCIKVAVAIVYLLNV